MAALLRLLLALLAGHSAATAARVPALTPLQKASLLVVSGEPAYAPRGVGGILIQRGTVAQTRPAGAMQLTDQEGGTVLSFAHEPPTLSAAATPTRTEAYRQGLATGRALHRLGVDVDLAPVLDTPDGPLGTREYRDPRFGVSFARGIAAGGATACAKHFPGLGSTAISTDYGDAYGVVRAQDLDPYRAAIAAGVECVMVDNAVYRRFGPLPACLEPRSYRLLRSLGFRGVTITDSIHAVPGHDRAFSAQLAVRAGADLVLTTSATDAAAMVQALVPLARRGELDVHVERVLAFRARLRARRAAAPR
jgi:beta-N-acetylhexosaminidase